MSDTRWDRPTRLLHLGLAASVTVQLWISLIMEPPGHHGVRTALESGAFEVHEWVGLAALAIVLAHWGWSLSGHAAAGLGHLFPWGPTGRARIRMEFAQLLRLELPAGGPDGGLAGLVHGLGLLTVTFMALSGGVLFILLPETGPIPSSIHEIGDVHSFMATFVWVYWCGHLAMAVLHRLQGHDTVQRMLRP